MLNQVETGPANDKIGKNDGSCATFFFFFFLSIILVLKKEKKKKGERNYLRTWFGIFQTSCFLGRRVEGYLFFLDQVYLKL
jgi:hypothetical protein